jgi:hypothetical protein
MKVLLVEFCFVFFFLPGKGSETKGWQGARS